MSPGKGCQPASGQLRRLHFKTAGQGKLLMCGPNHSTVCLKATLCFLDNGCRPKHTHSSFYDYKVITLLMVLSFPVPSLSLVLCFACSISSLFFLFSAQLCSLLPLLLPSCFKASGSLSPVSLFCSIPAAVVSPSFGALGQVFSH